MNIHEMQGCGRKTLQTFSVYPNENVEEIFFEETKSKNPIFQNIIFQETLS